MYNKGSNITKEKFMKKQEYIVYYKILLNGNVKVKARTEKEAKEMCKRLSKEDLMLNVKEIELNVYEAYN